MPWCCWQGRALFFLNESDRGCLVIVVLACPSQSLLISGALQAFAETFDAMWTRLVAFDLHVLDSYSYLDNAQ